MICKFATQNPTVQHTAEEKLFQKVGRLLMIMLLCVWRDKLTCQFYTKNFISAVFWNCFWNMVASYSFKSPRRFQDFLIYCQDHELNKNTELWIQKTLNFCWTENVQLLLNRKRWTKKHLFADVLKNRCS